MQHLSKVKFGKRLRKKTIETRYQCISDYIYPLVKLTKDKYEIKDHINLSGCNPLKGPDFISLTNIYSSKKGIIVAGLKESVCPNQKEKKILIRCGVKAYCYNLVQSVILRASHGFQVKATGIVKQL